MADTNGSAQPDPRPAPGDRRAAVRYACELETSCRSVAGSREVPWPARVRDISLTGICILVSRRFEPGTLLAVDLQNAAAELPSTLIGRVVRVNRQADGDWALGCVFATPLSEEELHTLTG
jgi:hypothetical protein